MSLVSFAVRVATVRAIRAVLWSGITVEDSPQAPLELIDKGQPLIAVYSGTTGADPVGRDIYGAARQVHVSIQCFLPEKITVPLGQDQITIDTRQRGAETVMDVIGRRILYGLIASEGTWAKVWRGFVQTTPQVVDSSYLVENVHIRASAREWTLHCDCLSEPLPGASLPANGPWPDLIAAMQADTDQPDNLAALANWVTYEFQGGSTLPDWQIERIALGISTYALQATGGGNVEDDNSTDPVVTETQVTVLDDNIVSPDPDATLVIAP